ncbi:dienelactone hydrolase family protein [Rivularia sp. UHCC 0363]|uniref:dienelactone hydrolase family protein n=1 Tax=Rivularia sp. UHCC 0363 TaxID=3110244 RepID=UPI002B1F6399|nr:dienelactone hydrolase family protein [Rivularia sp. UHCC 0363]MEA5594044.1 dienelactone hydrolase family protein [Rivularia sp. UHCC 0363]
MTTNALNNIEQKVVSIKIGSVNLQAELIIPSDANSIIVFIHGHGVGRYSTRNRYLAHVMRQTAGVGTVSIDLLTPEEEAIGLIGKHCSSNVQFLAKRLVGVTDWLLNNDSTSHLKVGYFGDCTGGGAALLAAAQRPMSVGAIVSRSGETCLTSNVLAYVQAPTLLIVGENDLPLIAMNQDAFKHIQASKKQLEIIPGASQQFSEPGALDEVARLASSWFAYYLGSPQQRELFIHAMPWHQINFRF